MSTWLNYLLTVMFLLPALYMFALSTCKGGNGIARAVGVVALALAVYNYVSPCLPTLFVTNPDWHERVHVSLHLMILWALIYTVYECMRYMRKKGGKG